MKRILLFSTFVFSLTAHSQNVIVQSGASFIASGTPTLVLNNMGLDAAANTTDWQAANLVVSGNAACLLKNNSAFINLQNLTVNKPGATLNIANHVQVYKGVQMVAGLFDLSGHNLYLSSNSIITGETETARITGLTGGFIETVVPLFNANNFNPGGMGVFITTATNTNFVTIRRGHKAPTGTGLNGAVNRYYDFSPAYSALNATLKFTYFDAELNGQPEAGLQLLESTNSGASWTTKAIQTKDAAANFITATALNSLYRYTLGSAAAGPLPVTGLDFFVKRLNALQVQLDWKTVQETSNKGFDVERKCDNESVFVQKSFVASKAGGGNSALPLNYTLIDTNAYNGKTYYRLKQTDINGLSVYSAIRVLDGNAKTVSLTAWPVPSAGSVNVRADGIATDMLQVWDAGGRLVKQTSLSNAQPVKIDGLSAGNYILRLKGVADLSQKIVLQ